MNHSRLPTFYIPHGGGPCFFMDPPPDMPTLWNAMATYLCSLLQLAGTRPQALLVISAHWECPKPTVLSSAQPPLLFDYYGFPEHTYRLSWPAPGATHLIPRLRELLGNTGFDLDEDAERGYDHGVFVPLKLTMPEADIPVLQLSLLAGLDPAAHITLGQALAPLRDEGVLIVGSGLSYHNLRHFFSFDKDAMQSATAFDDWLNATVTAPAAQRERGLINWENAPGARACHPRSEHLLPLMVAAGAGGDDAGFVDYRESLLGKMVSGIRFGATASR
jgi:aromatic ring-opening dioxygenase catalytic subunit (LigB family)